MNAAIAHLLPTAALGEVRAVRRISTGQSGAGVYAVDSDRGAWVLRISAEPEAARWALQLRLLRQVAGAGLAPAIVHVDEAARAVVQVRIVGGPLTAALADPAQRRPALVGVVDQLRALHALDAGDVDERDPVAFARAQLATQRARPGFPGWAAAVEAVIGDAAARLAGDSRRVLGHNDVNPGNVIWDGTRAWLIDWDGAGRAHPFYDLAALAMFLQLDDDAAHGLLALQEQWPLDDDAHATFAALRRLAASLCGLSFLALVPDLGALPVSPPTLADVYGRLRAGTLDLQQAAGRAVFALGLLQVGVGARAQRDLG